MNKNIKELLGFSLGVLLIDLTVFPYIELFSFDFWVLTLGVVIVYNAQRIAAKEKKDCQKK